MLRDIPMKIDENTCEYVQIDYDTYEHIYKHLKETNKSLFMELNTSALAIIGCCPLNERDVKTKIEDLTNYSLSTPRFNEVLKLALTALNNKEFMPEDADITITDLLRGTLLEFLTKKEINND